VLLVLGGKVWVVGCERREQLCLGQVKVDAQWHSKCLECV
jgi:hypothetical protein